MYSVIDNRTIISSLKNEYDNIVNSYDICNFKKKRFLKKLRNLNQDIYDDLNDSKVDNYFYCELIETLNDQMILYYLFESNLSKIDKYGNIILYYINYGYPTYKVREKIFKIFVRNYFSRPRSFHDPKEIDKIEKICIDTMKGHSCNLTTFRQYLHNYYPIIANMFRNYITIDTCNDLMTLFLEDDNSSYNYTDITLGYLTIVNHDCAIDFKKYDLKELELNKIFKIIIRIIEYRSYILSKVNYFSINRINYIKFDRFANTFPDYIKQLYNLIENTKKYFEYEVKKYTEHKIEDYKLEYVDFAGRQYEMEMEGYYINDEFMAFEIISKFNSESNKNIYELYKLTRFTIEKGKMFSQFNKSFVFDETFIKYYYTFKNLYDNFVELIHLIKFFRYVDLYNLDILEDLYTFVASHLYVINVFNEFNEQYKNKNLFYDNLFIISNMYKHWKETSSETIYI